MAGGTAVKPGIKSDKIYGNIGFADRASNGTEVYRHVIMELAEEYIDRELEGDRSLAADNFTDMIFYIADRIDKPDNADIEGLDNIFNIFIRLCSKCHVLPTLEVFSFLVGINRATFTDWSNGEYRSSTGHGNTVKKWFDICKSFTVNRLHNKGGTDANLIFIAKAAYGMAETAPVQTQNPHQITSQTPEEIAAKYGKLRDNQAQLELPEVPE